MIAEKGYSGVTMRELAEKSGVAYKSLYDLYGSKDNLLGKAIEERLRLVLNPSTARSPAPASSG